jgi:hypothetical protein
MNEEQITKTQLKKEILDQFDYLSPAELMKLFVMIYGHGEVEFNEVDWNN